MSWLNAAKNVASISLSGHRLSGDKPAHEEALLTSTQAYQILMLMAYVNKKPAGARLSNERLKMVNAWLKHIPCHPQIEPDAKGEP